MSTVEISQADLLREWIEKDHDGHKIILLNQNELKEVK